MGNALQDKTVVVVGHGSGIARTVAPDDIAGAVLFALTNTFMTGMTLKIDGGEPLV